MYIGHLAVAFAAKRVAPKTSLGTLIAASQMVDLIWPILVLTGLEVVVIDPGNIVVTPLYFKKYPYSHSLVAVTGWASLFALAYWIFTRYRPGRFALWALIIFLIMTYFANVFGPPPPQGSERVVILTSLLLWILLPWGYWIDRHRRAKAQKTTLNTYNPLIVLEQEED